MKPKNLLNWLVLAVLIAGIVFLWLNTENDTPTWQEIEFERYTKQQQEGYKSSYDVQPVRKL